VIALAPAPSYPIAFLAGLVSFLSPCVFPLMPAYAAYLSGRAGQRVLATADGTAAVSARARAPVIANGVAFVLGFSLVFMAVFYVLEVLDVTVFKTQLDLVNRIAGAIIMVLALHTMGILRIGFLMRERRIHLPAGPGGGGAFLLGLTFAAGWTPCLGPQLGAIITVAQARDFGGLPFMVVYCLGLAVPFLVVAALADRLQGVIRQVNRHLGVVNLIAGALLFAFGFALAMGWLTVLSSRSFSSPFNL
jgi:cytochrome c-type biogenesis protein